MTNLPNYGPDTEIVSFVSYIEHNLPILPTSRTIERLLMGRRPAYDRDLTP